MHGLVLRVFAAIALAGLWSGAAAAEIFEATPFVGYRFGGGFEDTASGEDLDLDESASHGLVLGFAIDDSSWVEVLYSRQQTELRTDDLFTGADLFALDVEFLHAGGSYRWDLQHRARPFITGGLGFTRMDPRPPGLDTETRFSVGLGGGVLLELGRRVGLRFEGRGLVTFFDTRSRVFCSDNQCQIEIDGTVIWHTEFSAGVVLAF